MEKEEFAMWTRAELKQNAKDVLRNNYWMAFAVSLVYSLITGIVSSGSSFVNNSATGSASSTGTGLEISPEMLGALLLIALLGSLIGLVIGFVLSFFVFGPMQVGMVRYYMESRNGASSFGQLFYGFKRNYMNTATAMFLTNLFVSLWSLLLIVPGIIKGLAWSQVPYILAENPNLSGARARAISAQMTDGQKWEIFVLQLSFLGWILLGSLLCGIGLFFVEPYVQATYAELYAKLRDRALSEGFATLEELPGALPLA